MEIHRPKAIHGVRELLKEVGIIVLGVLIALGAEQTVEALHWRHKIHDAAAAMRLEMRDDDGPQGYVRIAAEQCFANQLDAIQAAVEAGRDRRDISALIAAYTPPIRTWDQEAWKAAVASDVGSHVSAEQMVNWSKPYRTIPALQTVNTQERADMVGLQPIRAAAGRPSAGEEEAILTAVQRLRNDNRDMARLARTQLFGTEEYGMAVLPAERRRILDGLRALYGGCVLTPSTVGVDPNDQLSALRRRQAVAAH